MCGSRRRAWLGSRGIPLVLAAFSPLVVGACSSRMHVQVIHYGETLPPPQFLSRCEVDLIDAGDPALGRCRDLGDVFVADTGWSMGCGKERVRREIWSAACHAGANAVVIRRVRDVHSSCYNARARLLHCREAVAEADP